MHKRNDPKGVKNAILFLLLFVLTFLSEMKIKLPRNAKQKTV